MANVAPQVVFDHSRDLFIVELSTSLLDATRDIARRAGVKKRDVPVFFTAKSTKPPTLQRVTRERLFTEGKGASHSRALRRVIVGRDWLRECAPETYALIVAARLTHFDALAGRTTSAVFHFDPEFNGTTVRLGTLHYLQQLCSGIPTLLPSNDK